jgi:hypothetical protein
VFEVASTMATSSNFETLRADVNRIIWRLVTDSWAYSIEGDARLFGDDPAALRRVEKLSLALVRQLDAHLRSVDRDLSGPKTGVYETAFVLSYFLHNSELFASEVLSRIQLAPPQYAEAIERLRESVPSLVRGLPIQIEAERWDSASTNVDPAHIVDMVDTAARNSGFLPRKRKKEEREMLRQWYHQILRGYALVASSATNGDRDRLAVGIGLLRRPTPYGL